jgi:hypothetical protein
MYTDDIEEQLRQKFRRLEPFLDEKVRRLAAANEALALGFGGIAMVARASGLSVPTIRAGIAELDAPDTVVPDRIRRPGVTAIFARAVVPEQMFRRCQGILGLAHLYPPARLEQAATQALRAGALSYRAVKAFCEAAVSPSVPPAPTHANVRGADYYTQKTEPPQA